MKLTDEMWAAIANAMDAYGSQPISVPYRPERSAPAYVNPGDYEGACIQCNDAVRSIPVEE